MRQRDKHQRRCGAVPLHPSKMIQNSAATTDEAQASVRQHDQPKGLMRLPPELRVKIYELVLIPERLRNASCSVNHLHGHDMANTSNSNKVSLLRMNVFHMRKCIQFGGARRLITGNSAHVAILSTCRKVFEEASAVLYEYTSLEIEQPYGFPSFSNSERMVSVLSLCPSYGLKQIRHFSLAFRVDAQKGPYQLVAGGSGGGGMVSNALSWPTWAQNCEIVLDRILLPKLKTVQLHIDVDLTHLTSYLCPTLEVEVLPFERLHSVADLVEFVIDIHIYRAWHDDGSGWGSELVDDYCVPDDEQADRVQFWAPIKEIAMELRKKFIGDLSKVFESHGKELKLKEGSLLE